MTLLEGIGLTRRYRLRDKTVEALTGVSLRLEEGEFLGVAGESGSGKSTLLRLLSGLEAPDGGEILLRGKTLSPRRSKEEYRSIQMIFQDAGGSFHPRRTMEASIRDSVRTLRGAPPDMEALAAMVGLPGELLRRYPRQLSGGQCQRFAIARAVAAGPEVLLCDEITSALDVSSQAQILRLLAGICRDKGMSAVFVSHDLAVISCLCDRVLVLKNGSPVEEGPVRKIIDEPQEAYTRQLVDSVLEIK